MKKKTWRCFESKIQRQKCAKEMLDGWFCGAASDVSRPQIPWILVSSHSILLFETGLHHAMLARQGLNGC